MTVELFEGKPEALAARLAVLAAASTVNFVFVTHQKGKYIIMYT